MLNELPKGKDTKKCLMDAVIREMVVAKTLDQLNSSIPITVEYEVDSLERAKVVRKSPDQPSPPSSNAPPMDEEMTMQNAVINAKTGEVTISQAPKTMDRRYAHLPELVSPHSDGYSLVSEVYVNDGYTSPTESDCSGPEIQYEPENPGHLMIKVHDSPSNYVKHVESEYEPDTLDRKPMKLKINGDVHYERTVINEVFVDSLERPGQILLRSKGSFSDLRKNGRNGSLREIYEARLLNTPLDKKPPKSVFKKCLSIDSRVARRQRAPQNQPDVVPLPLPEEIYQRPKPPRKVEDLPAKNGGDRSRSKAGSPAAAESTSVPRNTANGKILKCP